MWFKCLGRDSNPRHTLEYSFKRYKLLGSTKIFEGKLFIYKVILSVGSCVNKLVLFYKYLFLVWLQNRLISAVLEQVLIHNEKICIASYYKQFFTNNRIKIIETIPVLSSLASGLLKTGLNLTIFHFNIHEYCHYYDVINITVY